mmetsp:Transcript_26913/g.75523  ORF Transcript_26913/g.75523 Transcript_26913/m.75523 type:complete len:221 (+) Transcript_26913:20-682(+)|eukprot:scaffold156644_cov27-Tisochrysis_lutea.AAC.1
MLQLAGCPLLVSLALSINLTGRYCWPSSERNVPRRSNIALSCHWRKTPGLQRKRLVGSFVNAPSAYDDHPLPDDEEIEEDDIPSFRSSGEWSHAATLHQIWWADPLHKSKALKARHTTHRANPENHRRQKAPLSVSGQKRSNAMKLCRRNEAAWSEHRRSLGADARKRRDPEGKAELQRQRSERARKGHLTRQRNAAAKKHQEHSRRLLADDELISHRRT